MTEKISRVTLIVLDSAGVGALPDADKYGDEGSNTFFHCAKETGGLYLPNLARLGLGNIIKLPGVPPADQPAGAYGKMAELSPGKDTITGHWEIAGLILDKPFPLYPDGFPPELVNAFVQRIGRPVLGNKPASGTVIIEELGPEHIRTGYPIVYTSADSVFQIAAHEEVIPLEELYRMCGTARELLCGEHAVGRVIARPFAGQPGGFYRTADRHDYSLSPTGTTLLDLLVERGLAVLAVGKIEDIFAGKGITGAVHTVNNMDGVDQTIKMMQGSERGLIFTNLVDFDMVYGHRNDVRGYADALEAFDRRLPEIIGCLRSDEALIITADHGCDPTTPGTDHTREYVPLLAAGAPVLPGINLGTRETFADLAASIAEMFGFSMSSGRSFAGRILNL
jgi:phosphopentomutase